MSAGGSFNVRSNNSKALLIVIVLFGFITTAQFFAAIAARSDALWVDCFSMLVDTLTYAGNLCAERCKQESAELVAAGVSLLVLSGVAAWGIVKAGRDLLHPHAQGDLSPTIVLVFGLWGILFDCFSFWGFYRWGSHGLLARRPHEIEEGCELTSAIGRADDGSEAAAERCNQLGQMAAGSQSVQDSRVEEHSMSRPTPTNIGQHGPQDAARVSMNMRSAFLHVGADFLRSTTTVVEGLAVIFAGTQARATDAVASMVVSSTILVGAFGAAIPWGRQVRKWRRTRLPNGFNIASETSSTTIGAPADRTEGVACESQVVAEIRDQDVPPND